MKHESACRFTGRPASRAVSAWPTTVLVWTGLPLAGVSAIASAASPAARRVQLSSHGGIFLPGGGKGLESAHGCRGWKVPEGSGSGGPR